MNDDRYIYWHSKDGMAWVLTDVLPTPLVGRYLAEHPDAIYDDGYGNRYRRDLAADQ